MYRPLFNTVLVELEEDQWARARGNDDNLGGEVYREGKLIAGGTFVTTQDYPNLDPETIADLVKEHVGKIVMFNEGHEAGTIFEVDNKKYALLYWWDLRGVADEQ